MSTGSVFSNGLCFSVLSVFSVSRETPDALPSKEDESRHWRMTGNENIFSESGSAKQ